MVLNYYSRISLFRTQRGPEIYLNKTEFKLRVAPLNIAIDCAVQCAKPKQSRGSHWRSIILPSSARHDMRQKKPRFCMKFKRDKITYHLLWVWGTLFEGEPRGMVAWCAQYSRVPNVGDDVIECAPCIFLTLRHLAMQRTFTLGPGLSEKQCMGVRFSYK